MKRIALAAVALTLAPALSGCGFTPLYATEGPTAVAAQLQQVSFAELTGPKNPSRYFLGEMRDALPTSVNTDGRYQLTVALTERRQAISVTASANTRRFDYYLFGEYVLTDTLSDTKRKKKLETVVSYGVVESQYASLVGREDAERRAAEELARKMELDIALFLKGRAPQNEGVDLPDVFNEELIEGGLPEERATATE